MDSKGVFTPVVCFIWSESVGEVVNLERFALGQFGLVSRLEKSKRTKQERPALLLVGYVWGREQESKYRKKVLTPPSLCRRLSPILAAAGLTTEIRVTDGELKRCPFL